MTSSFTIASTVIEVPTDQLTISTQAEGEEVTLVGGDISQDVRGVRLMIEMETLGPRPTSGDDVGTDTLSSIWLQALQGAQVTFRADTTLAIYVVVVPDLSHHATLRATRRGVVLPRTKLRFKSLGLFAPNDAGLLSLTKLVRA